MGYHNSDNDLYQQTNRGKDIFEHYLGRTIQLKKLYHSVFRKERTPSMSFYMSENNVWRLKDFGGENVGPIELVMRKNNVDYKKAIEIIRTDLAIEGGVVKRTFSKTPLKPIIKEDLSVEENEPKFTITYLEKKWGTDDIEYWLLHRIPPKYITEVGERVIPIQSYTIHYIDASRKDITIARSKDSKLLYAYVEIDIHGQERIKIYNPLSTTKKYKWMGNTNKDTIQGWTQLKYEAKYLIITSSKKDYLSLGCLLRLIAPHVKIEFIAPNAEGVLIDGSVLVALRAKYDYIFTFLDWDDAGERFSKIYQLRHRIDALNCLLRPYNVKDIAKLAEYASDKELKEFIEDFLYTINYESNGSL